MFGSPSGGRGTTRADVEFRANIGQFRADVNEARQVYQRSTGQMSDAALRMAVAQEKLDRAIHKHGAESRQAKEATLSYRNEMRSLQTQADRTDRELSQTSRTLERASRGALAGSGAFRSLRGSIAFASASFLGGAGLVYGIRRALSAASNLNEQTDKTRRVFGAAAGEVERFARDALGLARDQALELTSTLGALFRPIGIIGRESAKLSEDLVQRGVDLSSFYNREVMPTLEALRAGIVGEAEPLRVYGVRLSEARVQALALAQTGKETVKQLTDEEKVRARIAIIFNDSQIAADNYRETIGGVANQEREAAANYRDTQAAIGQALTPAYQGLLRGINEYLGNAENQRRIQEQVNQVVADGEKVVRGFAAGLKLVKEAAEPVVDAVGGVANAVELATILWVGFKVKALLGFSATAAASALTSRKMIVDAALAGAAWDVATRPRVMPIGVVGAGAFGGGAGRVGRLGRLGRGALTIGGAILAGATLRNPVVIEALVLSQTPGAGTDRGDRSGQYPLVYDAVQRASQGGATTQELEILKAELGRYSLANAPDASMARAERRLARLRRRPARPDDRAGPRGPGALTQPSREDRGPRGGRGGTRRTEADIELDLARAGGTETRADDARYLRELRALYERQIRSLENRKELTKKQKDQLRQLYGDLAGVQSQLDAIAADGEQNLAARRQRTQERLRDRLDRRERALENREARAELTKQLADDRQALLDLIAFYRQQARNDALTVEERQEYVAKRIAAQKKLQELAEKERKANEEALKRPLTRAEREGLSGFGGAAAGSLVREAQRRAQRDRKRDGADKDEKPLTRAELNRALFEFVTSLHGVIGQFGSNISLDDLGQVATHSYVQTSLLHEQNDLIRRLTAGAGFSGTAYARADLAAAGLGAGF